MSICYYHHSLHYMEQELWFCRFLRHDASGGITEKNAANSLYCIDGVVRNCRYGTCGIAFCSFLYKQHSRKTTFLKEQTCADISSSTLYAWSTWITYRTWGTCNHTHILQVNGATEDVGSTSNAHILHQ